MKKSQGNGIKVSGPGDSDFIPLARWQVWLCRMIMMLEYIPAYRRFYLVDSNTQPIEKPEWRFLRHGLWGFNLLVRLGLFWRYIGPFDSFDNDIEIITDFGPTPPWIDAMRKDLEKEAP